MYVDAYLAARTWFQNQLRHMAEWRTCAVALQSLLTDGGHEGIRWLERGPLPKGTVLTIVLWVPVKAPWWDKEPEPRVAYRDSIFFNQYLC